jgi:hypothetical protein
VAGLALTCASQRTRRVTVVRYALVAVLALTLGLRSGRPAAQRAATVDAMAPKITIQVTDKVFNATLADDATAAAFVARLPMSLRMADLNANEKFVDLPTSLPTRASIPSTIHAGDLMLYGSRTVVLFYKTFQTTYSYTPIGRIDRPGGLQEALGPEDVVVSFATLPKAQ